MRGISEDERALLVAVILHGSDGYPVQKLGRGWVWGPWRSVTGPPCVFKTKREAVASFEAFLGVLREAKHEVEMYEGQLATAARAAELQRPEYDYLDHPDGPMGEWTSDECECGPGEVCDTCRSYGPAVRPR